MLNEETAVKRDAGATVPQARSNRPAQKAKAATQSGGGDWIGGLFVLLALGAIGAAYDYCDKRFFSGLRPWTLFVFLGQLAVLGTSMVCFALVLIRMCQSDKARVLGILAGLLTPCLGLGSLIAFFWGWTEASRPDEERPARRASLHRVMSWWTACVVVQALIVGYVVLNWPTASAAHPPAYGAPAPYTQPVSYYP